MWVACRGLRGGLGGWAPRGAVSVFGGFGLVVGVGGGGWGAISDWRIHCSIHLQMCST